jgi:hypothetical protein
MSNLPSYRIVAGAARNHSENVWGVQQQYSPGYAALGQGIQPGMLIGRKNAINLAVWLLRAFGVTRAEVDDAMAEAMRAPMHQGFRAFFGDDEP